MLVANNLETSRCMPSYIIGNESLSYDEMTERDLFNSTNYTVVMICIRITSSHIVVNDVNETESNDDLSNGILPGTPLSKADLSYQVLAIFFTCFTITLAVILLIYYIILVCRRRRLYANEKLSERRHLIHHDQTKC